MRPPILYQKTLDWLRSELPRIADEFGQLPTEQELCKLCHASLTTVRKALKSLQQEQLVYRRHGRGTFMRPRDASNLSVATRHHCAHSDDKANYPIGVLIQHNWGKPTDSGIYAQASHGVCLEAVQRGYTPRLAVFDRRDTSFQRFLRSIENQHMKGCVLIGITEELPQRRLQDMGIPLVLVDHWPAPGIKADSFETDSEGDTREVVKLLAQFGHTRIAFLDRQEVSLNPHRRTGYESGLRDIGIEPIPDLVQSVYEHPDHVGATLKKLLTLPEVPTAIIAYSNFVARLLLGELRRIDAAKSEGVSVVGFGGILESKISGADISSMTTDFEQLGKLALRKLLGRIAGDKGSIERTMLPGLFVPGLTLRPVATQRPMTSKEETIERGE